MFSASVPLSTPFLGHKSALDKPSPPPPRCVRCRPSPPISAAYATAERTTASHISTATSYYDILGIRIGATCQEIKTAYRRLARASHPDVASNGEKHGSADEFIRIHSAYATLSDPEKRADYDRTLFRRQRPLTSSFAMSQPSAATTSSSASSFSGYTRRNWETDQCW
ncbi:J domain-containing protein [Soehngenia saccharolytica]|nr:J domain-containing protein [Soehngenia saccharolytica]